MALEEWAKEVLQALEGLRSDLTELSHQAGGTLTLPVAWERLTRWKSRAITLIHERVSAAEAERLKTTEPGSFSMIDPMGNFREECELYDAFFDGLIDDVRNRPRAVFGAIPIQKVLPHAVTVAPLGSKANTIDEPVHAPANPNRRVFVVHGHDEVNLLKLERLLSDRFKLKPVVLRFVAGKGRTLIEKFEQEAEGCGCAFVLLTPDDVVQTTTGTYAQARPNVAFELGWFCGRIGRSRVTILMKEGTELHSDLDGISRVEFAGSVEDRIIEIERELAAAGLYTG